MSRLMQYIYKKNVKFLEEIKLPKFLIKLCKFTCVLLSTTTVQLIQLKNSQLKFELICKTREIQKVRVKN